MYFALERSLPFRVCRLVPWLLPYGVLGTDLQKKMTGKLHSIPVVSKGLRQMEFVLQQY